MALMIHGSKTSTNYNRPLYGLSGKYSLSERVSIPYLLASVSIDRVIDELKIAEQIPPSLENQWSINELYQREIDRGRINVLAREYLADAKKLKFFNAITIILMQKADGILVP